MSGRAVARVVQARVKAAGLDPKDFAGNSLRAGFLTAAARAGVRAWDAPAAKGEKIRGATGTRTAAAPQAAGAIRCPPSARSGCPVLGGFCPTAHQTLLFPRQALESIVAGRATNN